MGLFSALLTIVGLAVFEIITSIDNAIINANVLATMSKRARRWFLLWGMIFAVLVVRGLLPFLIIFLTDPSQSFSHILGSVFSGDSSSAHIIEHSSRVLLTGGGIFLVFLFLHWVFLEEKNFAFGIERVIQKQGVWFYAIISVILLAVVWIAIATSPILAIGAVVGSTSFFIIHGVREQAEKQEKKLQNTTNAMSDISKILYLEILDATFSIDGVVGAFAFTFSVILILIGNGIGAIVLRQLTVGNIDRIQKYKYLRNGAMYSIFVLGSLMLLNGLGHETPSWLSPLITLLIVGFFFQKSARLIPSSK